MSTVADTALADGDEEARGTPPLAGFAMAEQSDQSTVLQQEVTIEIQETLHSVHARAHSDAPRAADALSAATPLTTPPELDPVSDPEPNTVAHMTFDEFCERMRQGDGAAFAQEELRKASRDDCREELQGARDGTQRRHCPQGEHF